MLVVQADAFNESRIETCIVVVITSNTSNAAMLGNVFLPASSTGLARDSSANVSNLITLNKDDLDQTEPAGELPGYLMDDVDSGLRLALDL